MLDTVQAVARGEDVNAKTIGRDLLTNTLMAGAQVAGGSGKNEIAGTQNKIKPDPDIDHIIQKDKGTNSFNNAQVLSREENRAKWNK